ncbi:MAG: thioredoxin family protein [Candidatus Eiseniibacteriota bacterium]
MTDRTLFASLRAAAGTLAVLTAIALPASTLFAQSQDAPGPKAIALGSSAPKADVKMKGVDGKEVTIAQAAGKKGTLVVFSCNACPWVKKWEDRIAALGNEYSKKGVGVIIINSNDPAKNAEDGYDVMVTRAKSKKFAFPYVVDATSDVARAFGASRTPEVFLFDAQGKLVYHGAVDDNADNAKAVKDAYLDNALASVVSGKPVTLAETKSMGCTIKFRGAKAAS